MASYRIPFNRPFIAGPELSYISDAVQRGHASGDGYYSGRCHALLEDLTHASKALLTTSGTHALELMGLLLDLSEGDEVIVPSFTFVSTVNAFVLRGARPVFVDVRPDTLNLDERLLESAITERTKALVVVHYAGVACEMDEIQRIAARRGIAVLEDNAHGLFAEYRGVPLGSIGPLGALSFHETKNISCGEGGALLVNDPRLIERAEILREKGTDRARFFRGQVDKYTWVDVGSSYLPSDLLAAYLLAQLEARDDIQSRRRRIWENYAGSLQDWAAAEGVQLPHVPEHCTQPYHMFYVLMPAAEHRDRLIRHLASKGILAVFHYQPLHASRMGRTFAGDHECPVTEDVSARLVRLPFYTDLSADDQREVIREIQRAL